MAGQVTKALNRTFNKLDTTPIPENRQKIYLDESKILGLMPKTKGMLHRMKEYELPAPNTAVPDLDYHPGSYEPMTCKFSVEYLKTVLQILTRTQDSYIRVSLKRHYPITFETTEMKAIIAPNVEGYPSPTSGTIEGETTSLKALHTFIKILEKEGVENAELLDIKKYVTTRLI